MAPPEYFLRLQKGITGGFAPPSPSAIHTLAKSSDNPSVIAIQSLHRPDGTPDLAPLQPKEVQSIQHDHRVDELIAILKGLPTEQPPGSQDIYELDTSIAFGSQELEWVNGGPAGCNGQESSVQATEEQKAQFARAVALVHEIVGE